MSKIITISVILIVLVGLGLTYYAFNLNDNEINILEEEGFKPNSISKNVENIETIMPFPTPEIGASETFWDYYIVNRNNNIIITKQEATCNIYSTYRQCTHEFQFSFTDGTNVALELNWTSGQWDSDNYNFDSNSPTLLTFNKVNPSNMKAKYSTQFEWKNRTWIDILYDEETGEEYNNTIIIPYKEFYNWQSININQVKRTLLKNEGLFV